MQTGTSIDLEEKHKVIPVGSKAGWLIDRGMLPRASSESLSFSSKTAMTEERRNQKGERCQGHKE